MNPIVLQFLYPLFWIAVLSGVAYIIWLITGYQDRRAELRETGATQPKAPLAPAKQTISRDFAHEAPVKPQGHSYVPSETDDSRSATASAVQRIPAKVPLVQSSNGEIPLLYDGATAHTIRIGHDGHWGIFGTTGSGKGNALQLVALSVLNMGADAAQLVVLDAKGGVDYSFCDSIHHAQLFTDDTLSSGCEWIVSEMRKRLALLRKVNARNPIEYERKTGEKLPLMVVIADEIADFTKDQRDIIYTLIRMCRAAGIVLFVATQYPTADVLSNQAQSNVTNRVVFRLSSSEYTRVALRRQKSDNVKYEPSAIPMRLPGVAVLRQDADSEMIGRAPEVSDTIRDMWIDELAMKYPKGALVNFTVDTKPAQMTREMVLADVVDYLIDNPGASQRDTEMGVFGYTGGDAYRKTSMVWNEAQQQIRRATTTSKQTATERTTAS